MGWILTIGGGIIVGIVVLIIEYRYFNKRREDLSSEKALGGNISQVWSTAIDNALQSFSKNYPNSEVKVLEMKIKRALLKNKALVAIRVETPEDTNFFYLEVDKSGDILRISDRRHKVFGWD